MRFRYTYQKIVDLKTGERRQSEWELAKALGILKKEEQALRELNMEKESLQETLGRRFDGKMPASELQFLQTYLDHLQRKIHVKANDVARAKRNLEEKKNHLAEKMKEEKVWTKAREKAREKHLYLWLKKEQQEIDEMASVRFGRS